MRQRRALSNSHPQRGEGWGGGTICLAALLLFAALAGCQDGKSSPDQALIASDPSSMLREQSITCELTTAEPFFEADLDQALSSGQGLVLQELAVLGDKSAIAVLVSSAEAEIALHRFEIVQGKKRGVLDISVVAASAGPGTVSAEGTVATAGAWMAELEIHGQGTHFDDLCQVEVQGCPGLEVQGIDVVTETWIDLTYSIALYQEPTGCTLVLVDGNFAYDIPFTVIEPQLLTADPTGQSITAGQVGPVTLSHSSAQLSWGTGFVDLDDQVEAGDTLLVSDTEVQIPVRVPFDFPPGTLPLTAHTYTEGGAFLEIIQIDLPVHAPAYLAAAPSQLTNMVGDHQTNLVSSGFALTAVTELTLEDDALFTLSSWQADQPDQGTATLHIEPGADAGGYVLEARTVDRALHAAIVLNGPTRMAHPAQVDLYTGDELLLVVAVQGGTLAQADLTLTLDTGESGIDIIETTWIDPGSAVARLFVDPQAQEGYTTLVLTSSGETYNAYVRINDSGL